LARPRIFSTCGVNQSSALLTRRVPTPIPRHFFATTRLTISPNIPSASDDSAQAAHHLSAEFGHQDEAVSAVNLIDVEADFFFIERVSQFAHQMLYEGNILPAELADSSFHFNSSQLLSPANLSSRR
jgi:hypothetical protein